VPLPTLVVIGAMKCGTTAVHSHLHKHPGIAMAPDKELNFFFGPERPAPEPFDQWWRSGQWHRGPEWYAARFEPSASVRGETSPGYTDPSHPDVAARMQSLLPDVRLVYLVRDPVERAASQWAHHVRDGTESRALEEALLDPDSQYLDRSRYHRRARPFLQAFDAEQLLVVVQERLLADPRGELRRVFDHVGADPDYWDHAMSGREHEAGVDTEVPTTVRRRFWAEVSDDVEALRSLLDDELPEWHDPRR
jgi:Sulfotransferase family